MRQKKKANVNYENLIQQWLDEVHHASDECPCCGRSKATQTFRFCPRCGCRLTNDISPLKATKNAEWHILYAHDDTPYIRCSHCGHARYELLEKDDLWFCEACGSTMKDAKPIK